MKFFRPAQVFFSFVILTPKVDASAMIMQHYPQEDTRMQPLLYGLNAAMQGPASYNQQIEPYIRQNFGPVSSIPAPEEFISSKKSSDPIVCLCL